MYLLTAKDLVKIYGEHTKAPFKALNGVSLNVEKGEFLCIMGPSGAGKSTLLNNISTIDKPTSGSLTICGEDVLKKNDDEICDFRYHHLGFVFQEFNLLDSLTVYENIALPLSLLGKDEKYIDQEVVKTAKALNIEKYLDSFPGNVSGGQRQRVAIARAIVSKPEILIADEPTGNLDSENGNEIMKIFDQINKEGTTIIMVTHSAEIGSYSSRLVFINDGLLDTVIERNNRSQQEYYYDIVKVTSSEADILMGEGEVHV